MLASIPDLLRLLTLPVFGWVAWRDVRTRRVPNEVWYPLAALGILLVCWEGYGAWIDGQSAYFLRVALSLGFVVPLAYAFWLIGGFGGADAKAFMTVAVLFPVYPTIILPDVGLPLVATTVGVFSLTILSNTVVVGAIYPLAVAAGNLLRGHVAPQMLIGKPVSWDRVPEEYGRLLETPEGFSRSGVDLDALRMYLQWRGTTLAELRENADSFRDPASLPDEPNEPGDGAIATDGGIDSSTTDSEGTDATVDPVATDTTEDDAARTVDDTDDPWGATRFLDDIDHGAYGTSPEQLRDGLDVLTERDVVWISPGIPFLVPLFVGLVVSFTYGDVLIALIAALTG